jgi:hypothetical protein
MKWMRIILALILAVLLVSAAENQSIAAAATPENGGYALNWYTLDGGGSMAPDGAGYALSGSIAQPDAQTWESGSYSLKGGFWPAMLAPHYIFLPNIRN